MILIDIDLEDAVRSPPPPNKPRSWIGGFALLLLASTATAQKPQVERFTVDHGLPNSAIFDLDQDASGRLWIVSRGGISVYDGRSFKTIDDLPKRDFRSLEIDRGGRVWTVTQTLPRVHYLEGTIWRSLPKVPETSPNQHVVTSMTVNGRGDAAAVVLGTIASGLLVWSDGAWSRLESNDGLPSDRIHALTTHQGDVIVGTNAGICQLSGLQLDCRLQTVDARLSGPILGASSIAGDDGPELWLLGQTWVGQVDRGELSVVAEGFDIQTVDPTMPGVIATDRTGGLYFGSSAIGFYFGTEDQRPRRLGSRQGLASEGATALWMDRESNVWVGSLRGLNRIASWRFESYDRDDGLLESEVTAFAETKGGTLVIGHNSGLTFIDGEQFTVKRFERPRSSVFGHRVLDMAVDEEGTVWIAAQEMGLLRVPSEGHGGPSWTVAATEKALSVDSDAHGNLWFTTRDVLFNRQGTSFVPIDVGSKNDNETLRWVHAADDGRLFVGGRGGLRWREHETWQVARGPTLGSNNVFNVHAQSADTVWIGTGDGLYRLAGHGLEKVRQGELAIDRPVFLIVRDPKGRMWFGTDGGVVVWDGREARLLTARHGLIGRETNRGAGWIDPQGRMWIGTDKGMSMYREHHDIPLSVAPLVQTRTVEVDDRTWPAEKPLELSHRQRNLTFHFDAVSLSYGKSLSFRHRLEGFDDAWLGPFPLSAAEVRYTHLPPGTYRFEVAAGSTEGSWSEQATSAAIVIARPFWSQPWFYALAVAAIGLGVPGVYRLRTRAIRAHNTRLETLNQQLSSHIEERESLISELEVKNEELERFTYTVSHDLKSPLVTIRGFLGYLRRDAENADTQRLNADIDRIENATETMARLLDDLLELSRVGRVAHEPEVFSLSQLVMEACELVEQQITDRGMVVEVSPDLPEVFADRGRFLEIFQNLIENAAKFMGDQASPRLEIGVQQGTAQPVIYVRDNGIGIDPRFQEQVFGLFNRLDQTIDGTGVGLTLVRRIVEIHGGKIWVESKGKGHGTTFFLTVPTSL